MSDTVLVETRNVKSLFKWKYVKNEALRLFYVIKDMLEFLSVVSGRATFCSHSLRGLLVKAYLAKAYLLKKHIKTNLAWLDGLSDGVILLTLIPDTPFCMCVCVCDVFLLKLHITAQSGPVILLMVILCH